MKGHVSQISTIFNGKSQAYIYIWVSKRERLLYVGQTNERYGTWGRGYRHITSNGTLRIRCSERIGLDLEQVGDLVLISFNLPNIPEFISNESAFRLAVEYLVQSKLYEERSRLAPVFRIISNISPTAYTSNSMVKEIAESIVKDFASQYPDL